MIGKLINAYIEIVFKIYSYSVGHLYLAFTYMFSFIFPPLKRVNSKYEKNGSNSAIAIISIISGTVLFLIFIWVIVEFDPTPGYLLFVCLAWYIGYFVWGYFALFLLSDFKAKANKKISS